MDLESGNEFSFEGEVRKKKPIIRQMDRGYQDTRITIKVWGASNLVTVPRNHRGGAEMKQCICGFDFSPLGKRLE